MDNIKEEIVEIIDRLNQDQLLALHRFLDRLQDRKDNHKHEEEQAPTE